MIGNEELLEKGEEFLNNVKKYSKRENCVYGIVLENGEIIPNSGACHGNLMDFNLIRGKIIKVVAVATRIQTGSIGYSSEFGRLYGGLLDPIYFKKYYEFLLNQSNFSECYVTKTTDNLRNGGVVVVRCDKPQKLVVSACIAVRRGWEYSSVAISLINMIEMGVHPNIAHMAAYQINVTDENNFQILEYGDHKSVRSDSFNKSGYYNFLKNTLPLDENNQTYYEVPKYNRLFNMWNSDRNGKKLRYLNKTRQDIRLDETDPFNFIKRVEGKGISLKDVLKNAEENL